MLLIKTLLLIPLLCVGHRLFFIRTTDCVGHRIFRPHHLDRLIGVSAPPQNDDWFIGTTSIKR